MHRHDFRSCRVNYLTVILFAASLLHGQQPAESHRRGEFDDRKALQTPGEVVSRGTNESPEGNLNVKTYRIERLKLEEPIAVRGNKTVDYAYKLVITGGPFQDSHLVWLNDQALRATRIRENELAVLFVSGTPTFLEEGATISVTTGANPCGKTADSESTLPERLSVPSELRAPPYDSAKIQLRTVYLGRDANKQPAIEIVVTMDESLPVRNAQLAIQVGKESFWAGGMGTFQATSRIPYDAFARIPDNSQVIVKWDRCSPAGVVVGHLNKSAIDR